MAAERLAEKGFSDELLGKIDANLSNSISLTAAFAQHILGDDFLQKVLNIPEVTYSLPGFDLLKHLGFSDDEISAAELYSCGAMTMEGAPGLKEEHLADRIDDRLKNSVVDGYLIDRHEPAVGKRPLRGVKVSSAVLRNLRRRPASSDQQDRCYRGE